MVSLSDHLIIVLVRVGSGVRRMVGVRGAQAIFRQVGRDMAQEIIHDPRSPNLSPDEAKRVAAHALVELKVFQDVQFVNGQARLCHCMLGEALERMEEKPGQHPLCFLGLGFIEGTVNNLSGQKIHARLEHRDSVQGVCIEPWDEEVGLKANWVGIPELVS